MRSCVSSLRLLGVRLIGWFWMNMTSIIFCSLTLVKVHARCRGGALGLVIATVVYRIESKGAALSTEQSPTDTAPHCDRWPPFRRAYLLCSRPPQLGGRRRRTLTEKHVLRSRF